MKTPIQNDLFKSIKSSSKWFVEFYFIAPRAPPLRFIGFSLFRSWRYWADLHFALPMLNTYMIWASAAEAQISGQAGLSLGQSYKTSTRGLGGRNVFVLPNKVGSGFLVAYFYRHWEKNVVFCCFLKNDFKRTFFISYGSWVFSWTSCDHVCGWKRNGGEVCPNCLHWWWQS